MNQGPAPRILCTGITVLDEVYTVEKFPAPDGKVQATGFFVVTGGCANATTRASSERSGWSGWVTTHVDSRACIRWMRC